VKRVGSLVNVYTRCCLKAEPTVESDQHKLLKQIQALFLQKSCPAVQALVCLAEVGIALFTVPETKFQPADVRGRQNCIHGRRSLSIGREIRRKRPSFISC